MTIGEQIKKLRVSQKMTQQALAEQLHISRQSISKWETNVTQPTFDNIVELSNIFQISLDELLREDPVLLDTIRKQTRTTRPFVYLIAIAVLALLLTVYLVPRHSVTSNWIPNTAQAIGELGMLLGVFRLSRESSWSDLKSKTRLILLISCALISLAILINLFGGFFSGIFRLPSE